MSNFKYPYLPKYAAGDDLLRILIYTLDTDELGVLLRGVYWCCNGWPDDDEREWFIKEVNDNSAIDLALRLIQTAQECAELKDELQRLKVAAAADKETMPKPVSREGDQ